MIYLKDSGNDDQRPLREDKVEILILFSDAAFVIKRYPFRCFFSSVSLEHNIIFFSYNKNKLDLHVSFKKGYSSIKTRYFF